MDYIVELEFDGPGFVAVPNGVVDDARLSAEALAVLVIWPGLLVVEGRALCAWPRSASGSISARTSGSASRASCGRSARFPTISDAQTMAAISCARWSSAGLSGSTCEPENPAHREKPVSRKPGSHGGKPGSGQPENPAP